jgi:hypothetical protein
MKKFNLRSGNKSVSRMPPVSIIGLTALNNMVVVANSIPIMISFSIHEDQELDDTANGLTKKIITRRRETPKRIQEYLVFSLYWTM